ncbi:ABC transporter permease [Brackiella oedipodis]|uniref:ABC transporter permease n=1 Tax=Brackiella oedipodis TaxID=124225 RepID=UPI000688024C|nr:iron chelate uptake ABC transporter family permease subunit [Brackiella oedipodis]
MSSTSSFFKPKLTLGLLLIALSVLSLLIGAKEYHLSSLDLSDLWFTLLTSRFPRLFTLALCGIGLAMSGIILQHITHNRFAEPSTTGSMDAAKLGILVSLSTIEADSVLLKLLFAVVFCFVACAIFIVISQRVILHNPVLIPIIGLMFGSVLSAIAEFYAYQNNMMQDMQNWLVGDFSKVVQGHYEAIYLLIPTIIIITFFTRHFTLLNLGKDVATSLGLRYKAITILGLVLVSCMVSISVVIVGAIPFVGLVIPNIVAIKYGDNLSNTLSINALGGAVFTIFCDLMSRLLVYPLEIPIGLTAGFTGGVVFIFLILRTYK